jgi:acyl transferase domain-containing protein
MTTTVSTPAPTAGPGTGRDGDPVLLLWSARDEEGAARIRAGLARRLGPATDLARTAADVGAQADPALPVRGAAVVRPGRVDADLAAAADPTGWITGAALRRTDVGPARPVALLLPGHGSQHPRMGAQLYRAQPVFTRAMDAFFDGFVPGGAGLRAAWLDPARSLDPAELGQPLLFALGHALARTVIGWGVTPAALIGHSIGEFAAATVAGVARPADAARLMAARTAHYAAAPAGGVLAVAAAPAEVAPRLPGGAVVAVVNAPGRTMVAGDERALAAAADRLRAHGLGVVRSRIPAPFHSPWVGPLADQFTRDLATIALCRPTVPIYSTRTARPVSDAQAVDPAFWAQQVATPVLFWAALDRLLTDGDFLLVEAGPGRALTNLARRHPAVVGGRSAVVNLLPVRPGRPGTDAGHLLGAAGRIWLEGHPAQPLGSL